MKRRSKVFLGILLSFALVVGLIPGVNGTASADETANGPHTHDDIAFKILDESTTLPTIPGDYYFYLTQNVSLSGSWTVPKGTTTLCLNGHRISGNRTDDVIKISDGSTLNLYDCSNGAQGTIDTGLYGVRVGAGGTFNLFGGTISGNSGSVMTDGGGVGVYWGTFNMYGGVIRDNETAQYGAGVYVRGGTFNMFGGVIRNNSANDGMTNPSGGGVFVEDTFNMHGGMITGNNAKNTGGGVAIGGNGTLNMDGGTISKNTAGSGGGIMIYSDGSFIMSGGTISQNSATGDGGGVYDAGKISLFGKPTIIGNFKGVADDNNVFLGVNRTFNITGELSPGASVGVCMEDVKAFTSNYITNNGSTPPSAFFSSDRNSYTVALTDDGTEAVLATAYTVSFYANSHGTAPESQIVEPGGKVSKPEDPVAEGYAFSGWYKEASCTNAWDFGSDRVTQNTTLYAKWKVQTRVIKAPMANTLFYNESEQQLVTAGEAIGAEPLYALGVDAATAPDDSDYSRSIPTGTDVGTYFVWYKFVGMGNHTDIDPECVTVTIALPSYTVTFSTDSHGTAPQSQTILSGGKVIKPEDPVDDAYSFGGWYREASCENAWNFESDTVTETIILYAKWTKKEQAKVTKAPTAKSLVYNESVQELVTAGEAEGGEIQYASGRDATTAPDALAYTTSIPTGTDVGTYYVWYKVVGDSNHLDKEAAVIKAVIVPPFDAEHVNFILPAGRIEANAFAGDEAIAIVDAGYCTSLGEHAFRDCRGLTQILLSADCEFPASAFEGCEALIAIYAPGGGKTQKSAEAAGIPFMPVGEEGEK